VHLSCVSLFSFNFLRLIPDNKTIVCIRSNQTHKKEPKNLQSTVVTNASSNIKNIH